MYLLKRFRFNTYDGQGFRRQGSHKDGCQICINVKFVLKLARTHLNYCVLSTGTTAIFLSKDNSVYAPIYLG